MSSGSDKKWRRRWLSVLRRVSSEIPADLGALLVLVALCYALVVGQQVESDLLRVTVGVPLVLFAPGYAVVAVLFPRAADFSRSVTWTERTVLSFGTSLAVSPLVGVVLDLTLWRIQLLPVFVAISGVTLVLVGIAAVRRLAVPPEERLTVPLGDWMASVHVGSFARGERVDLLLSVLLVVSLVAAGASVANEVTTPPGDADLTELYLLTENESGRLVADDYPTEFAAGETRRMHVGLTNHEGRQISYTIVVELQRVDPADGSSESSVTQEEELYRTRQSVSPGESWVEMVSLTPNLTGSNLRLAVLAYVGPPPQNPTVENAYRETHLWVNVTADNQSTSR